jgi:UDP-N-acetylglucosamine acyltransferase
VFFLDLDLDGGDEETWREDEKIHPTAQIHSTALVERGARIGRRCVIHPYATVTRFCELAQDVTVHPFAVIGGEPQDVHFDAGTFSQVRIGARTVVREHVTINRATNADDLTLVGADCFLMASCHVAHDCSLGDGVVMANAVLLGGHVQIEKQAFIGGGAVIHQFCRIGELAMIGGGSRISQDVPRFCLVAERNALIGLNAVGLRRHGISAQAVQELKKVLHMVLAGSNNPQEIAVSVLSQEEFIGVEAHRFLNFFQSGCRGFADPDLRALASLSD